ncbi:MAG: cytochrome c biogenesis heme-transporting ATPase CcmA [Limnohabitans sp.]
MSLALLEVDGLACERGGRPLFEPVSFSLCAGEWLHLQGDNGAGKTSLMRMVSGLSPAITGEVRWAGMPIRQCAELYRAEMLYLGHTLSLKDDLSALENLQFEAAVSGESLDGARALQALAALGLRGREHLPLRVLSQGQKRRAALARLLTTRARLWLLDEPFVALDPGAVTQLADLLSQHVHQGGLVLYTSHQAVPMGGTGHHLRLTAA